MNVTGVVSTIPGCFIELIQRKSNPGMWIVRRSWKRFLFKKQVSSHWFIDGQQALAYAQTMKQTHEEQVSADRRVRP